MFNLSQFNKAQFNSPTVQPTQTYPNPPLTSNSWLPEVIKGSAAWTPEIVVNNE